MAKEEKKTYPLDYINKNDYNYSNHNDIGKKNGRDAKERRWSQELELEGQMHLEGALEKSESWKGLHNANTVGIINLKKIISLTWH